MFRAFILLCFGLFFGTYFQSSGQISFGGIPLEFNQLKSSDAEVIEMPKVDNFQLLKSSVEEFNPGNELKPFRFAHTFDVDISVENNGAYFENINGYNVWQVKIKSESALSLNVIFDPYYLPPGAKVFILNADKTKKLGAFTDFNNKSFKSLAVSPLAGDEIIVQYEEPVDAEFKGEIGISKVNHDFYGVVASGHERRPLGIKAGICNIDINCDLADDWEILKNSVCRIFIDGNELCTGTLMNNTSQDETPYILTANHCYENHTNGEQNSIFLFNYQSPYCGDLDGDNSNSISGSVLRAEFDSLDFSLVEMTLVPPPGFRPYYAGWDNSGEMPNSVACIHHPVGDNKKIAIDNDSPVINSFRSDYKAEGFWQTLMWEYGTTESGSSGGGYFNQDKLLVGTLTGGSASCSNSINDYFARFDLNWDYFEEKEKQLKYWLDPTNSNVLSLEGLPPFERADYCDAFTNMKDGDTHQLIGMLDGDNNKIGYWGGSNSSGITEFVERFSIDGDEILEGLSLGIGLLDYQQSSQGFITINVYNGISSPGYLIYSKDVLISEFVNDAMNFVGFDDIVETSDTFFVGFDISNLGGQDSLAVYQSYRKNGTDNTFYVKQDNQWFGFDEKNSSNASSSLAFEIIACNVLSDSSDTTIINPVEIEVFPNPTSSSIRFDISENISEEDIFVFDILGRQVNVDIRQLSSKRFEVTFKGNRSGVYFLRIQNVNFRISRKISYLPN